MLKDQEMVYKSINIYFLNITADRNFPYQAKKKDPVGSRKSPEKKEGLSGP